MRSSSLPCLVLACFLAVTAAACNCGGEPTPDAGMPDAGILPFQPSNVSLTDITAQAAHAKVEDVGASCSVTTDTTSPQQDCFTSPITVVTQHDGSTVNLVVMTSLKIETAATVRVTGTVPLVLISLGDVTVSGAIDGHSELLSIGPGGAVPADSNAAGAGPSGGAAGSSASRVGGSGGSFCGVGGNGGGQTASGTAAGTADVRPLKAGSAGGGGEVGSGAGGGAIQISAGGTLSMLAGSAISVGGQGGPIGGLATNQNAGGGGSGGAILLEATSVTLAGTIASNGGGGGGDYSGTGGADATATATPAMGGAAGTSDGAGGTGSGGATVAGGAGTVSGGINAGGGGGAAGWIRVNTASGSATLGGTLSPDKTTSCASVGTVRTEAAGP